MRLVLAALSIFIVTTTPFARTWYVTVDGTGDAPTIQAGIDSAAVGDTVLLGCGTYLEHSIQMKPGIVLSSVTGVDDCATIDAGGQGRVLTCADVGSDTWIQGITFTDGHAFGVAEQEYGGGLYLSGSSPHIRDCSIVGNTADWYGGGLFCWSNSSPVVERCAFEGNTSKRFGGGVGVYNASPQLIDCEIDGNSAAAWGGGVCVAGDARGSIRDSFIHGNSADRGGGIAIQDSRTTVLRCEVYENEAADNGGGVYCLLTDAPRIVDCVIRENRARTGGGVHCGRAAPEITGCFIGSNSADDGGGLYLYDESSPSITGCVVSENTATRAGAIFGNDRANPAISACVLFGNSATVGAGTIYLSTVSEPVIANTILFANTGEPAVECFNQSSPHLMCCDVYGNSGGDWVGCVADQYGVSGNLSANPLFCNPDAGDFTVASESPCAPENSGGCGLVGTLGVGCTATSVPAAGRFESTSWGSVKSMFR